MFRSKIFPFLLPAIEALAPANARVGDIMCVCVCGLLGSVLYVLRCGEERNTFVGERLNGSELFWLAHADVKSYVDGNDGWSGAECFQRWGGLVLDTSTLH